MLIPEDYVADLPVRLALYRRLAELEDDRDIEAFGAALDRWLRDVETGFEDRVLPVTLAVAAAWGRHQYARPLPVIDALVAATARVHGMTVVTRNVKDFDLAGVQVLNPFTE